MIIGITISLAGKPSRNARRITPSNPIKIPIGSRKEDMWASKVIS